MIGLECAVRVPGSRPTSAMLDLNKSHPSLNKAARGQHLHSEVTTVWLVDSVKNFGLSCLLREVKHLRHGTLHAKRQFIQGHAGGHRGIVRIFDTSQRVKLPDKIQSETLRIRVKWSFQFAEIKGIMGVNPQWHGIVRGARYNIAETLLQ